MEEVLPSGWTKEWSRSQNRHYYFNATTGTSVWKLDEIVVEAKNGAGGNEAAVSGGSSSNSSTDDMVDTGDEHGKRKLDQNVEKHDNRKKAKSGEGKRRVVVIVPFRDLHAEQKRKEHLDKFVPHMERFLSDNPGVELFHILIVEQSDDGRKFNRGKLLNIGFQYAQDEMKEENFDAFIFHDVDLLPQPVLHEWYAKYPSRPLHIARCWGRYNDNPKYFGGIVSFSQDDFERIDGFPNTFWGWGGEDDELEKRVKEFKLRVDAPFKYLPNAIVDLENFKTAKSKLDFLRKTDWKCKVKWEVQDDYTKFRSTRDTVPWWGLKQLKYEKLQTKKLGPHSTLLTVDVLYNYNADGSEHWANKTLEI